METLKSSFKHLQGAITNFKPISPICIQEAKTQSFREGDLFSALRCSTSSTSFAHEEELTAMPTPSSSPGGPLSSDRFFFSPCTTKSILEEAKTEKSTPNVPPSTGKAAAAAVAVAVAVAAETTRESFYHESITMAMSSEDPYQDFRSSMEEMVAAHGLREWHSLQELLQCYLRLNEKKNHKVIVMAFVDLLMHLMDQQLTAASVRYRDP